MFKIALCILCSLFVSACSASDTGPEEPNTVPEAWSVDSDPAASYAAEVARFTQRCQSGSAQIVTVSGADVYVDVEQEALTVPLKLYTFKATIVDGQGTRTYAFRQSGVRQDGAFDVWSDDLGADGRIFVRMTGRFEVSDAGATRVSGQIEKNALENQTVGHRCSDVHEFSSP